MRSLIILCSLNFFLHVHAQQKEVPPRVPTNSGMATLQPEQCSVTVSAPFDTGLFTFTVSVTLTGPCTEIKENGEDLAWQLLWQLIYSYKAYN